MRLINSVSINRIQIGTFQRCTVQTHTTVIKNCHRIPSNTCLVILASDSLLSNSTAFFRNWEHEGENFAFSTNVVFLPREYNSAVTSLSLGDINHGRTKKTITPRTMSSPRFLVDKSDTLYT